jgi:serine/threonine-protein kinase
MFALTTGRFVHEAETPNEQLLAAMTHRAPPLASLTPAAPLALAELVDRALRYEKEERWPDAAAMQNAVRAAYHGLFGEPITTAPRLQVPDDTAVAADSSGGLTTGGRSPAAFARTTFGKYLLDSRRHVVAGIGAVVLLLGIGAVFLRRSDASPASSAGPPSAASDALAIPPSAAPPRPSANLEPSRPAAPVLSPSQLPLAGGDPVEPTSPKRSGVRIRAAGSASPHADRPPSGKEKAASRPAPRPPTGARDVLDQQW